MRTLHVRKGGNRELRMGPCEPAIKGREEEEKVKRETVREPGSGDHDTREKRTGNKTAKVSLNLAPDLSVVREKEEET